MYKTYNLEILRVKYEQTFTVTDVAKFNFASVAVFLWADTMLLQYNVRRNVTYNVQDVVHADSHYRNNRRIRRTPTEENIYVADEAKNTAIVFILQT